MSVTGEPLRVSSRFIRHVRVVTPHPSLISVRLLQPFILIVTAILAVGYTYVSLRIASGVWDRLALAVPFVMVWIVPVVYWSGDREDAGRLDELVHVASYLSMAWLSFLVVLTLARDAL